ncbi:CRM-domain containing factor CFM3, chloroplastic/mitochondrial [Salvia miltiorrhiza]|uniref:CRM-domain containing factor CFM3, chloroplastic/mitochondrial n=1 Tax=Salvia miltiorrhiza TaxID=226208 RepID=UPI0025AB8985|nr:CRM-domain containing factor CFM3, chloroplastic/mitochondrial [Salvia miltiorrhiza]
MAFSSLPSNFLSPPSDPSPSQSLFFLLYNPKPHSSSRAGKLKISCCQLTVQFDNEPNLLKTKKRKPRPSFLEQVHKKWSQKMPSLRENFPWQEQEIGETNQEFPQLSPNVSSVEEPDKSSRASDPVRAHVEIKSNSAPWAHGSGKRKVFISDGSRSSAENVGKGTNVVYERPRNEEYLDSAVTSSDNSVKDVMIEGESERKFREFDEAPIGLPPKIENLDAVSASVMEDPPAVCRNAGSIKSSAGGGDLNKLPWKRMNSVEVVKNDKFRDRKTVSAERSIPEHELKRLRNVSLRMVERIKVGAAGVTQALVNEIHDKWKHEEVVKLKFEGPPSKNMKRTHEFLESRTGGLVIWRSGSSVVLYRGLTYKFDCVKSYSQQADAGALGSSQEDSPKSVKFERVNRASQSSSLYSSAYFKSLSEEEQMDLSELNIVLDELGPRFMDWTGREPIPVDADLLPAVVPGYKTPYRLLPHGSRRTLRDKGMTFLRRAARAMPPHFALGRSRQLQGLAVAMVKLWEKCAIAKIVIKRGVLNTNNERMAEELKILTGGTLLSRNKEFIVLYRGNDFLPPRVSTALVEMEKRTGFQQDEEEQARHRAAALIDPKLKASRQQLVAGTLAETVAATSRWGKQPNSAETEKMFRDAAIARQSSLVESLQRKLALAKGKIRNAEKTLQKVLKNQEPEELPTDLETLTDEERQLFRRIGSSMKPYLVLGRREVFDGTIENMHLHWKYRELVKILVERKTFAQVRHIAISLEAESGGVLVSVERTPKGYVILVYRGKNYRPPLAFRPKNLLTKRQAFARSIELQRREALTHHIVELEERIEKMKQKLDDMMSENSKGTERLELRGNAASADKDGEDVETVREDLAL